MKITDFPKSNIITVINKKNKRKYYACFKNGVLGIYIFSQSKKSVVDVLLETFVFEENYTIQSFDKKPRKTSPYLYHDKTVVYGEEIKCIIKSGDDYFVNWYREEKGKPMTHKSFPKNTRMRSLNDYFLNKYEEMHV